MKINPDAPNFQNKVEPSTTQSKTGGAFAKALHSKDQGQVGAPDTSQTTAPTLSLSQKDLSDPAKVSAAVDQAIQQVLERQFRGMCAPDRQQVAAWLRNDPIMREALLKRITS